MGKYFSFSGVATRSEFWAVTIITFVLSLVMAVVAGLLFAGGDTGTLLGAILFIAIAIGGTWLSIATIVRRCRDSGLNPWWSLGCFVPYIGLIVWIVIGVMQTKNQEEKNGS